MTARLARAEAGDFTGLWEDMLKALEVRTQLEYSADGRRELSKNGFEGRRRVCWAQRLASRALYGEGPVSEGDSAGQAQRSAPHFQLPRASHLLKRYTAGANDRPRRGQSRN